MQPHIAAALAGIDGYDFRTRRLSLHGKRGGGHNDARCSDLDHAVAITSRFQRFAPSWLGHPIAEGRRNNSVPVQQLKSQLCVHRWAWGPRCYARVCDRTIRLDRMVNDVIQPARVGQHAKQLPSPSTKVDGVVSVLIHNSSYSTFFTIQQAGWVWPQRGLSPGYCTPPIRDYSTMLYRIRAWPRTFPYPNATPTK